MMTSATVALGLRLQNVLICKAMKDYIKVIKKNLKKKYNNTAKSNQCKNVGKH